MKLKAIFEQSEGLFCGCVVTGHAGYTDEDPTGEILCAAVSSAVQLTCNTLTECFHAKVTVTEHPDPGLQNELGFRLDEPDAVQSEILHGLLIHFQALREDFNGMISVQILTLRKPQS